MEIPRVVPSLPITLDEVKSHLVSLYPWLSTPEGHLTSGFSVGTALF